MKNRFRTKLGFSEILTIVIVLLFVIAYIFLIYFFKPPTSPFKIIMWIISILSLLSSGYGLLSFIMFFNKTAGKRKFDWQDKEETKEFDRGESFSLSGFIIFVFSAVLLLCNS